VKPLLVFFHHVLIHPLVGILSAVGLSRVGAWFHDDVLPHPDPE
jgi:hypothetical protein